MNLVDPVAEGMTIYFAGLRPVREAVDPVTELMVVWFAELE